MDMDALKSERPRSELMIGWPIDQVDKRLPEQIKAVVNERDALRERVKAAEAEAARLRDENQEAWHAHDRAQSRGDRLAAELARVAELEAAGAWRPVAREPERPGLYQTGEFLENGTLYDVGHTLWADGGWVDECDHELLPSMTHYRPIPPLPDKE